jgi:hypothetical protein
MTSELFGYVQEFPDPDCGERFDALVGLDAVKRRLISEAGQPELGEITVQVGEHDLTIGFEGRWLVEPNPDETLERDHKHGPTYYGVALTGRGRFAVYSGDASGSSPGFLNDYDSLDDAAADGAPADIIARAAAALGEQRVIWRDI